MRNTVLYIITVLIWGSTWYAIEFQIGVVAEEVALAYRFAFASLLMFLICWIRKENLRFSARQHYFIVLLALGNFSCNYFFAYHAQHYLNSAMASIAFSMMLIMNIINTRLFFGVEIEKKAILGAGFGILGLSLLFLPEIKFSELGSETLLGLGLALTGALIASFGNMVSIRNSKQRFSIFSANAWGMAYGAIMIALVALAKGASFSLPLENQSFLISLLFLSIFGTVVAFTSYFYLLHRIGSEKASYAIVLFPLVSIFISSIFEDFEWTATVYVGVVLLLLGNIIIVTPARYFRAAIPTSA